MFVGSKRYKAGRAATKHDFVLLNFVVDRCSMHILNVISSCEIILCVPGSWWVIVLASRRCGVTGGVVIVC